MQQPSISISEIVAWIIPFYPLLREKVLYRFFNIVKSNNEHIWLAIEDLEKEIMEITEDIFSEYKLKFWQDIKNIDSALDFLKQEDLVEQLIQAPIIGPIISIEILQQKEVVDVKRRMERSLNAFITAYRKTELQYEGWTGNTALIEKERKKLIEMSNRCYIDLEEFLNKKLIEFIQWIAKNPSPENAFSKMDFAEIAKSYAYFKDQEIHTRYIRAFDTFLWKMIDLISLK